MQFSLFCLLKEWPKNGRGWCHCFPNDLSSLAPRAIDKHMVRHIQQQIEISNIPTFDTCDFRNKVYKIPRTLELHLHNPSRHHTVSAYLHCTAKELQFHIRVYLVCILMNCYRIIKRLLHFMFVGDSRKTNDKTYYIITELYWMKLF